MGAAVLSSCPVSLWQQLQKEPWRFSLHQAIGICDRVAALQGPPASFRMGSHIFLAWPPSDLQALKIEGKNIILVQNVVSLAGAHGPLPMPFTEHVLGRLKQRDTALRDFLDLFNHRFVRLFHETVCKYRPGTDPALVPCQHPLGQVAAFFQGEEAPPGALAYAGLFWHKPRSVRGLEIFLSHDTGRTVSVKPFAGGWMPLPPGVQAGLNSTSGLGACGALGKRAWIQNRGIRVTYPAGSVDELHALLPGQPLWKDRVSRIRRWLDRPAHLHLALVWAWPPDVEKDACRLGRSGHLGWTTRLQGPERDHAPRETRLIAPPGSGS